MPFITNPEYLNQLTIAESQPAHVDHAMLASFSKDATTQGQTDALVFLLLAQLAADRKCDRFGDVNRWMNEFTNTAQMIGCVINNDSLYPVPVQSDAKLSEVILQVISDGWRPFPPEVMSALSNSSNWGAARIFTSSAMDGDKFTLLTGMFDQDRSGNVSGDLHCFHGVVSKSGENVVESILKKGGSIQHAALNMVLGRTISNRFRGPVMEKLGHMYEDNVSEVKL